MTPSNVLGVVSLIIWALLILITVKYLSLVLRADNKGEGGILALGAVCLGCLAPVLSVVGIGVGGAALFDIPKWLLALNTLLLTGWGTMFLSRRLTSCPVLPRATQACAATPSSH